VGHPLYVVGLETATHTLVVVRNRTFTRSKSRCGRYPGCRGTANVPLKMSVKIRSKHTEASAVVTPAKAGVQSKSDLDSRVRGMTS